MDSARLFLPIFRLASAATAAGLLAACQSERVVTDAGPSMGPILEKFAGNYQIVRDANGTATVKSDRRSEFESRAFQDGGAATMADKEYRTGAFATKPFAGQSAFEGTKPFAGTREARESGQKSRWHLPWKGSDQAARESGKSYDTGDDIAISPARDAGKSYPTRDDPKTLQRWNYPDENLDNVRTPSAGEGPGPTIRDIRGMLGKDG